MKKFTILIPVYNDWESLIKLLNKINSEIEKIKNVEFDCVVINDASTISAPKINKPMNFTSLKIINMKENRGHARCNAFGVRHISKEKKFNHLILMDGDGEDRPEEIKLLVEKAIEEENISVVAKRIKRSEGLIFQLLYQTHKLITIIFTGKNVNFGNYSCLTRKDVEILADKKSLWSSFSGSVKKHILKFNSINSTRGLRYFGPSKMSLFRLGIHSFSIIAVFKRDVFLRSVIIIIVASYFDSQTSILVPAIQFLLVLFCLLIYLVSLRENKTSLINSDQNQKNSESINA
jgi:glycosyltransferase involved in cell wall biosynthesis